MFEGTFTTTDFSEVVVLFNRTDGVFRLVDDGSLTIEKSGDALSEVYTGDFEGTLLDIIDDRALLVTDGSFEVHRIL